jgi:hypothetical protein
MPFNIGDKVKIKDNYVDKNGLYPDGEENIFTIKCFHRLGINEYRYFLHDNGDGKKSGSVCNCGKHNWVVYENILELVESVDSVKSVESTESIEVNNNNMNKKLSIEEYKKIIKIGDKIILDYRGIGEVDGEISNISYDKNRFDFCTDNSNFDGGGIKLPMYKYSYPLEFSSSIRSITLVKEKKHVQKRNAYVEIKKEGGKMCISFKIPSEIEDFFKSISEGKTKKSGAWFKGEEGVEYYAQPEELERKLTSIDGNVFSDFGSGLIRDGRINVAVLRCVGSSKGVKITSDGFSAVSNAELQDYIKKIGLYIKKLWESNISSTTIKSTITFEL